MMKRENGIVRLDEIGPVWVRRSRRAKHLNIHVRSSFQVWVVIPYGMSMRQAEKMILTKRTWIEKQRECWRCREKRTRPAVMKMPKNPQKMIRHELKVFEERYGYSVSQVSVRRQKTRWGSCSWKNDISLNVNIMRLPPALREYVILHELVHTRIKNHGQSFWEMLEEICPQAKKRRELLSDFGWLLSDHD